MSVGDDVVQRACLLVVDDDTANSLVLRRMLEHMGVGAVHTVVDPREATPRFVEVGADLVLLDLHMPHMDGFEVLTELQAVVSDDDFVPVVAITADPTADTRNRALQAGVKDFLTKPLDYTEVALRVRNLLATRALYLTVQQHNRALQDELDAQAAQARVAEEETRRQHERIDAALSPGVLRMVFQPIADLHTGGVVGVEALARFECEPRRPPNEWFAEAAAVGRGAELELAAVAAALGHIEGVPDELFLSINASPLTATSPELPVLLDRSAPERVVIELTEHTPVQDYPGLLSALEALRAEGVRVAVDDAGAGYAGLAHMLRLRPDILKLDTDLSRRIDEDLARRALATGLVAFAREIDCHVIAEGIETRAELDTLRGLEVGWGQGYHLARPGVLPLGDAYLAALRTPA